MADSLEALVAEEVVAMEVGEVLLTTRAMDGEEA